MREEWVYLWTAVSRSYLLSSQNAEQKSTTQNQHLIILPQVHIQDDVVQKFSSITIRCLVFFSITQGVSLKVKVCETKVCGVKSHTWAWFQYTVKECKFFERCKAFQLWNVNVNIEMLIKTKGAIIRYEAEKWCYCMIEIDSKPPL